MRLKTTNSQSEIFARLWRNGYYAGPPNYAGTSLKALSCIKNTHYIILKQLLQFLLKAHRIENVFDFMTYLTGSYRRLKHE